MLQRDPSPSHCEETSASMKKSLSHTFRYILYWMSPKVISNNESTKTEMNCPRKSPTIPPQITLPSWSLAFLLGAPSPSLAFGWDVLYWISPNLKAVKLRLSSLYTSIGVPSFRQGCRNPASKDGKLGATTDVPATANIKLRVDMLPESSTAQPTCYPPWPGFRHPCRNDGFSCFP